MTEVINNGYAEVVPQDQLYNKDGRMWYLPHHGVYHPRKNTLRVIFDCGAGFKGTSLNSQLLQGPDLTNTLFGVLTRFRQEKVALMTDIQAMFHQIKVSEKHVDFLRFLWWPKGGHIKEPSGTQNEGAHLRSSFITELYQLCIEEDCSGQ